MNTCTNTYGLIIWKRRGLYDLCVEKGACYVVALKSPSFSVGSILSLCSSQYWTHSGRVFVKSCAIVCTGIPWSTSQRLDPVFCLCSYGNVWIFLTVFKDCSLAGHKPAASTSARSLKTNHVTVFGCHGGQFDTKYVRRTIRMYYRRWHSWAG